MLKVDLVAWLDWCWNFDENSSNQRGDVKKPQRVLRLFFFSLSREKYWGRLSPPFPFVRLRRISESSAKFEAYTRIRKRIKLVRGRKSQCTLVPWINPLDASKHPITPSQRFVHYTTFRSRQKKVNVPFGTLPKSVSMMFLFFFYFFFLCK